jgi:hypothetical protein
MSDDYKRDEISDELERKKRRAEYEQMLNNLHKAPPEKLGMVLVADPRDTELTRLRAEVEREKRARSELQSELVKAHGETHQRDVTIARLEADALPPPRARVEGEWTLPYEFIDAIYEEMRSEPFTASMEAIETVLLSYEKLTNRALILSAPTGKGEM